MENCIICDGKPIGRGHHVWFGKSERKIAHIYGLKVPICYDCHESAHYDKTKYQMYICDKLGLDYYTINPIMKKSVKSWTPDEKLYMDKIKEDMK